MDVCVESALLSSLIAWSSANRMAVMGETLLYDGICPGNCFSFGTDLENRLLVEMPSTRRTEHVKAHWWWLLWFEFYSALVTFLAECEAFGHGFTSRIILCYKAFHQEWNVYLNTSLVFSQKVLFRLAAVGLTNALVFLDVIMVSIVIIELLFRVFSHCRDIFVFPI